MSGKKTIFDMGAGPWTTQMSPGVVGPLHKPSNNEMMKKVYSKEALEKQWAQENHYRRQLQGWWDWGKAREAQESREKEGRLGWVREVVGRCVLPKGIEVLSIRWQGEGTKEGWAGGVERLVVTLGKRQTAIIAAARGRSPEELWSKVVVVELGEGQHPEEEIHRAVQEGAVDLLMTGWK